MNLRKAGVSTVTSGLIIVLVATGVGGRAAAAPIETTATGANITRITTNVLEHSQFAHHPFDDAFAKLLLDRYADALDGARSLLFQTDMDEFAVAYGRTLASATRETGSTAAARAIFARYIERLQQRASYVADTLRTARFDFTGQDAYPLNRERARRPRDLREAEGLWRQELRAEYLGEKLADVQPAQIVDTLSRRYAQRLRTMRALGTDEVLEIYLDTLAHVYDPHSDYLGHEELETFAISMNLSLVGIGATLENADGYCEIRDLVPGGPAAKSGLLKRGDRIIAVAQDGKEPVDVVDMPLSRTVELIRGPKGSSVTLKLLSAGAPNGLPPRTATIVRGAVRLQDQAAKARLVDWPADQGRTLRLGVIDLPSFYADTDERDGGARRSATADVAVLLNKLKAEHVDGVVLDLRRNGGGSLEEAISLTGLFIRTGPVVQTRDPAGHVEVEGDTDPAIAYDGPLVLLTSKSSASASEILAGALQDYGRALVVGDSSTFGKGTVQSILPLAQVMDQVGLAHSYDPGAIKVTIRKFYRPSGASTQMRGVSSDVILPSASDLGERGESGMENPLPWDIVGSASYDHLGRVRPYVAKLRESSARRIGSDEDWRFLEADIARDQRRLDAKSLSLNEAERRRNLASDKAHRDELERAERAERAAEPAEYEITLENAASPGLPSPIAPMKGKDAASSRSPTQGHDDRESRDDSRTFADRLVLDEALRITADYARLLRTGADATRLDTSRAPPGASRAAYERPDESRQED
ncbi:MAG TPA: carboxy terminal-processing peptidase [Polyangiaceae bacterium]|jgi:carboxyl-terminal processing protease